MIDNYAGDIDIGDAQLIADIAGRNAEGERLRKVLVERVDEIAALTKAAELLQTQQKGRRTEEILSTAGSILGGLGGLLDGDNS